MPKQTTNINDFSGGINTSKNPRDMELNEAQDVNGMISRQQGLLELKGGFVPAHKIGGNTFGGFGNESVREGIPNLWGIHAEYSFRAIQKAEVTVSSDTATFVVKGVTTGNGVHGFSEGTQITVFDQSSGVDWIGKSFIISEVLGESRFQVISATGLTSSITVNYATGVDFKPISDDDADYSIFGRLLNIPATQSVANEFLLKSHNYNKFGHYMLDKTATWFGSSNTGTSNAAGLNPWLFDTRCIWDWNQRDSVVAGGYGAENNHKVYDIIFDSGHIRTLTDFSGNYNRGFVKRPVSMVYIPERRHFNARYGVANGGAGYYISEGWYPLRSHILCAQEYVDPSTAPTVQNMELHSTGGGLYLDYNAVTAPTGNVGTKAHQVYVTIGSGNNSVAGSWQFATGDHRKIGLGVSFVYDTVGIYGQESPISTLGDAITMTNCNDDESLFIYLKVFRGETLCTNNAAQSLFGTFSQYPNVAVPELRGSGTDFSSSNYKAWNPRIVAANIYLTEDYSGPITPVLLAEFPFDTKGVGKACDGTLANDRWRSISTGSEGQLGYSVMGIEGIRGLPVSPYSIRNGREHDENINTWCKTGVIVNRRFYAGNVSYFKHKPQESGLDEYDYALATHYPDRLIVSPSELFDILPETHWNDVIPQDGQSIVKLISFNSELLIFKENDLFVMDCSGEMDILTKTFRGRGIANAAWVVQSTDFVFWINENSIYGYSAQGEVVDLLVNQEKGFWKSRIVPGMHPVFDPDSDTLIVLCGIGARTQNDSDVLTIDILTGAVSYKSSPTMVKTEFHSGGVVMSNKLYMTGSTVGVNHRPPGSSTDIGGSDVGSAVQGESFDSQVSTEHVAGKRTNAVISFKVADADSSSGENILSANAQYLWGRVGGSWTRLNDIAFNRTVVSGGLENRGKYLIRDLNSKTLHNDYYDITFSYNPSTSYIEGILKGKAIGTGSNPVLATPGGTTVYGSTGAAFASGTSSSDIADANITDFTFKLLQSGTASTKAIFKISVNRRGFSRAGTSYTMVINLATETDKDGNFIYKTYSGTYVTGEYYSYRKGDDSWADDLSGDANELNDNLLTNLRIFLMNNKFYEQTSNKGSHFKVSDYFDIGSITGSSGAKYFNVTLTEEFSSRTEDVIIDTDVDMGGGGVLYEWDGESREISHGTQQVVYITPDIDFGEPNVRKKVHKVYVTYRDNNSSNNGIMGVFYQKDQSGTWSAATVTGATTAGFLDAGKTNFYRQEITFGSGGNNIYSFALKFENRGAMRSFEINDITFVYRMKSAK